MTENSKKRRAEEQLSPYSQDPIDNPQIDHNCISNEPPVIVRKARARRNANNNSKESLKGIFKNVSFCPLTQDTTTINTVYNLISGINKSFVKAIQQVISKQSDKDLTYLFKQYEKFINEIKENNK